MTKTSHSTFKFLIPFLFFICAGLPAQTPGDTLSGDSLRAAFIKSVTRVEYDLPLYEYPYQRSGAYPFPSMRQSLAMTKDATQACHWTLGLWGAGSDNRSMSGMIRAAGIGLAEIALLSLPGGYSWMHEEWHRAVLTHRGIGSYNGIYDFNILSPAIPVSHVADDAIADLKRHHPADMVRLCEAGNEAQIELVRAMRKELFFNRTDCALDWTTIFLNTVSPASYLFLCSMPYADQLTDKLQKQEGTDIDKRDVVGLDFTAWVYDLYRPREPYGARGTHPSGIGINRYIKRSELTKEEFGYLRLQGALCWLNLVNPQLFLANRFTASNEEGHATLFWNAALVHHLTPFGFALDADLMTKSGNVNLSYTLHSFCNRDRWFPGLSVELDDYPFSAAKVRWYAGASADLWLQPKDQMFEEKKSAAGAAGRVGIKAAIAKNVLLCASVSAKSAGWKAGDVSLERNFGFSAGFCLWLPNNRD